MVRGPDVTGRHFRVSGPREVMNVVKQNDGHLVEIVGIVRKAALDDQGVGLKVGGARVVVSPGADPTRMNVPASAPSVPDDGFDGRSLSVGSLPHLGHARCARVGGRSLRLAEGRTRVARAGGRLRREGAKKDRSAPPRGKTRSLRSRRGPAVPGGRNPERHPPTRGARGPPRASAASRPPGEARPPVRSAAYCGRRKRPT